MPRLYKPTGKPAGRPPKQVLIPARVEAEIKKKARKLIKENKTVPINAKKAAAAEREQRKAKNLARTSKVFVEGEIEGKLRSAFEKGSSWERRLFEPLYGIATPEEIKKANFEEKKKLFIIALAMTGIASLAASAVGYTSPAMFKAARNLDPEFDEAWTLAARDGGAELLEEAAMVRALAGVEEAVYFQGDVVGVKRVYDNALLQFMLKSLKPEKYGTTVKNEVDLKGQIGVAVIPGVIADEDEWERGAMQLVQEQRKLISSVDYGVVIEGVTNKEKENV